ncbi:MAG: integrase [Nitrosomonas sp.]|nr:integrase [Nitrosomonas sp.]
MPEFLGWLKPNRLTIFLGVFLVTFVISLGYVFSRPAIYQSYATLLTIPRTAIDQISREADIQHVTIQRQVLLGTELLTGTANKLKEAGNEYQADLTPAAIRTMLDVRPVADTNLVEMIAEGENPALLPILINTWIDIYLTARAEEVANSTGATIEAVQEELARLTEKIEQKRLELTQFRQHYTIVSIERDENEVLARLKGLNDALNTASEEEVKAKSKLDAIRKAVGRGEIVVPQNDSRTLSALEKRAQELREELEELDRQYTREFMALTPSLKVIPEKLAALEKEILDMRQKGQTTVLTDAEQEYAAAKQTARVIQQQLNEHRQKASEFTSRFAEHDALKNDLEALEQLYRDTQDRLVQIETRHTGKYPYVDVIERAFLPDIPVRPDYQHDTLIALLTSLLIGLIAVWLVRFLTHEEQEKIAIHLSDVHMHDQGNLPRPVIDALRESQDRLSNAEEIPAITQQSSIDVLSSDQIIKLFEATNVKEKQLLLLLLSGLSLNEITKLQAESFDLEQNHLTVQGGSPRKIPLHPTLKRLYNAHGYCLTDPAGKNLNITELHSLLTCLQVDAGFAPTELSAEKLRRTYILYLIKQGIRLGDLELLTGYVPPAELCAYGACAPTGEKQPFAAINPIYPETGLTQ